MLLGELAQERDLVGERPTELGRGRRDEEGRFVVERGGPSGEVRRADQGEQRGLRGRWRDPDT